MGRRTGYSAQKRRREVERAQRKRDKAARRERLREQASGTTEVARAKELQPDAFVTGPPPSDDDEGPDAQRSARAGFGCRLFVGSLAWEVTADDLGTLFEPYGGVSDAKIITDQATGDSRGFGFVTIDGKKHAMRALRDLDGSEFRGRTIKVDLADRGA